MDMNKKDTLERVAKAIRGMYVKGFTVGGGGNVSVRIQGQVHIFPNEGCLRNLTAEGMIMPEAGDSVPSTGGPGYGGQQSSRETGMHLAYYGNRPDMLCPFHLYSPYSITMTCYRRGDRGPTMGVPAYTPGYAMRVGRIPVVPYYRPGSRELTETISGVICGRDSLLLANHGMVAAGKSPEAMLAVAEEIEKNAHLVIFLGDQRIPLGEGQAEALFQTGGRV